MDTKIYNIEEEEKIYYTNDKTIKYDFDEIMKLTKKSDILEEKLEKAENDCEQLCTQCQNRRDKFIKLAEELQTNEELITNKEDEFIKNHKIDIKTEYDIVKYKKNV